MKDFNRLPQEAVYIREYKQAGNAIVVNVLGGIFANMFYKVKREHPSL